MRKLAMLAVLALGMTFCGTLAAQNTEAPATEQTEIQEEEKAISSDSSKPWILRGIQGKLLMYIPNRVVDLFDIFSISLETGLAAGITCRLTYAFGLVAEGGCYGSLIKGYNRQYGAAMTDGYYGQFLFPMKTNLQRTLTWGSVNTFWIEGWNYPFPSNPVFERETGAFDYWAIEAGAMCLVGARVAIHPVEILDFITGLFLIDISKDDYGTRALN